MSIIETDMNGFFDLASGGVTPRMALKRGYVRIEGDPAAFERCFPGPHAGPRTRAAA
jgi:hypothetical protein